MFKRILVVCIGNICRSPTAEALINDRFGGRGIVATSAGLSAVKGAPVDASALALLNEHGLSHSDHVARQISSGILADADLVLVMEKSHLRSIQTQYPQVSGKTFLLGKWVGDQDVPDPYRQQRPAFEHAYRIIDQAVQGWDRYLR